MHLLAFFVPYDRMPQEHPKRGSSLHQRAHSEQSVKPVAKLARKAFGNKVRRKPRLPVLAVAVVAQCGVGHDAGVEPGIADVRNPARRSTAPGAANFDQIHPWPVRRVTVKLLPSTDSATLELLTTANDVECTAALANPDGKRKPPVALL